MAAELVFHEKRYFTDNSFQEIKIWKVEKSKDKPHGFKYSFAYIVNNERVICYHNAEGKGDHRHCRNEEYSYNYQNFGKLWKDFKNDIERFREGRL
ncbi:MAG: hypothetical protein HY806_01690 [Nitrospirae bacterium]|nr:hypothetical protein [Nitrospirota bacterium]